MKLLLVDDDRDLLGLTSFAFRGAGYSVIEAADGLDAIARFHQEHPDLVILDVNLPGLSGFEVCRRIRAEGPTPILLLTVRNTEDDQVHGLDLGADDFLTKPFSPRTLLARVRALLRRSGVEHTASLVVGGLRLDPEAQSVETETAEVHLTKREFRLLQYLVANAGHTIPAERLTTHVWGYAGAGDRQLLKQSIHRVRQKIERDPAEPRLLLTVPGVGYKLQAHS